MKRTQQALPALPESQQSLQNTMDDVIFVRTAPKPKPKPNEVLGPNSATPTKQAEATDLPPYKNWFGEIIDLVDEDEDMPDTTPTPVPEQAALLGGDSISTPTPRKHGEESSGTHRPAPPKVSLPEDGPGFLPAMRDVLEQALGKETLDRLEQYNIQDREATDKYIIKLETAVDARYENFFASEQLLKEKMSMLETLAKGGDEVTKAERELLRLEIVKLKAMELKLKNKMELILKKALEEKKAAESKLAMELEKDKATMLELEKALEKEMKKVRDLELEKTMELEKNKMTKLELEKALEKEMKKVRELQLEKMKKTKAMNEEAKTQDNLYKKLQKKYEKRKVVNIELREEIEAQQNKIGELEKAHRQSTEAGQRGHQNLEDKRITTLRAKIAHLEQSLHDRNQALKRRSRKAKTKARMKNKRNDAAVDAQV